MRVRTRGCLLPRYVLHVIACSVAISACDWLRSGSRHSAFWRRCGRLIWCSLSSDTLLPSMLVRGYTLTAATRPSGGDAGGGFSACCQRLKCWHQCLLVAAQWQQALGLLAGMRKAALVLDVITDDAAISACVKLHADSSHLAFRQSCSWQIGCSLSSIETLPSDW